jgi:hypothetical protein
MAFADATSAGQDVCAIPIVADSEIIATILNVVPSAFLMEPVLSHCVF